MSKPKAGTPEGDNRSDQLNPTSPEYYKSRGLPAPSPLPSGPVPNESMGARIMREAREAHARGLESHEDDCELRHWVPSEEDDDDEVGPQCTCVGLDTSVEPMDKD
jgi:hypothetical protein